jgi:hypothetical protein
MYGKEKNEKKAGKGHDKFSPERAGEKIYEPIHSLVLN